MRVMRIALARKRTVLCFVAAIALLSSCSIIADNTQPANYPDSSIAVLISKSCSSHTCIYEWKINNDVCYTVEGSRYDVAIWCK